MSAPEVPARASHPAYHLFFWVHNARPVPSSRLLDNSFTSPFTQLYPTYRTAITKDELLASLNPGPPRYARLARSHTIPSKRPSSSASASSAPLLRPIPLDLSCLVRYEPLSPNYSKQGRRTGSDGNNFWAPPNKKDAYYRDRNGARFFRWKGGRATEIPNNSYSNARLRTYGVATVFGQYKDTPHLLAVGFDAETKDVAEEPGGWKVLSFNHTQDPQGHWYSSIGVFRSEQLLAAPGSRHWMPQLLPEIYDYDRRQTATVPTSAGLIGDLPILFGLVAFSAPPHLLSHVLTSCDTERGMVITVYFDPSNEKGSNKKLLDMLQQGYFGPFYRA
ncbi:MAG: hypothetical protein Q9184_004682 [Pyrenodesmia sp. 2 TL-2023]